MDTLIDYRDEDDQELYQSAQVSLGDVDFSIEAATIAGSPNKPNEDTFAVAVDSDTVLFGVFDGSTSLKQIEALGAQSGARFASHFLKNKFASIDSRQTLKQIMLDLNTQLLEASSGLGGTLSDPHSLPTSMATILKIDGYERCISFAHVGDSFAIAYYTDGSSRLLTKDHNLKFDADILSLVKQISLSEGITPRRARDDERVNQALVDMYIARNNNPNGTGSGFVNGDPNLAQYIQSGTVSFDGITSILIVTDGLVPPGWSLDDERYRQKLLGPIKQAGFKKLFEQKRETEDNDPDWHKLRFKHSDDATGILISFKLN